MYEVLIQTKAVSGSASDSLVIPGNPPLPVQRCTEADTTPENYGRLRYLWNGAASSDGLNSGSICPEWLRRLAVSAKETIGAEVESILVTTRGKSEGIDIRAIMAVGEETYLGPQIVASWARRSNRDCAGKYHTWDTRHQIIHFRADKPVVTMLYYEKRSMARLMQECKDTMDRHKKVALATQKSAEWSVKAMGVVARAMLARESDPVKARQLLQDVDLSALPGDICESVVRLLREPVRSTKSEHRKVSVF